MRDDNPESRVRRLRRHVRELGLDVEAIAKEHSQYKFGGEPNSSCSIDDLPIRTLSESLEMQRGTRKTISLQSSYVHKIGLRRLYDKTKDKLELKQHELNIAKIDLALKELRRIDEQFS